MFGFGQLIDILKKHPRKIVFTEGSDPRILEASSRLLASTFLAPVLVGNKEEIAKAAEELFQVQVLKVNTVNCTGHTKRMGRSVGKRPDFKKAVITINPEPTPDKDGKKRKGTIEFFDGMF